ncbi:hypothetical protein PMZ80_000918 [Knufia obscura]|uniref:Transcription factor TFIIIC triple barrel domain-containing protein n=1 Tax=Knufia obscura TaxID=1635080 RepID=A0ABR0S2N9_9EURO|nr:hypothetical protein PMZ80_000918 [Knufia obscura]
MTSQPAQYEDEWEYEYDQNDTEVFLVDLDLTTVNRTLRSTTENRNKRLLDLPDKSAKKMQKTSAKNKKAKPGPPNTEAVAASQEPSAAVEDGSRDEDAQENGVQLLDLHTSNPIISHQGQVYSCTWTDMIGTTMFFSQPRDTPLYDPEISTSDFDMIGMSRIKLVGREAKVTPIPQSAREKAPDASPERPGRSLGTIRHGNAKLNAEVRKQANFLEQLMNIKKNRGGEDNVHVAMNSKIAKSVADGKLKFNTQRRGEQIEELNRKVVRGDAEALKKLEQIYLGQHNEDSDDDVQVAGETPMRLRRRLPPQVDESDAEFEEDNQHQMRIVGTASPSSGSPTPHPTEPQVANPALNNTSNENG